MEIKVLGPGCAKCSKTEKLVREVIEETGVDATVEKVTDMMQIASYGVMMTPALVVDGQTVVSGKVPSVEELKAMLA